MFTPHILYVCFIDLSGEMDTFSSTIQDELSAVDDLTSDVRITLYFYLWHKK